MNETLKINQKFEQIIPPLTEAEFAQLEENILKLGRITDPIKVWNGVIIDGHHRYKVLQKYPQIPYTVCDLEFESEYEAIAWMCSAQLGRRNITEAHRQYLVGKRYDAEKNLWGGARRGEGAVSSGEIRHLKTRESIAKDINSTNTYVKYADLFAKGIDIAESIDPGIKQDILNGVIEHSKMEIYALPKLCGEELLEAVKNLRIPKDQRKAQAQEIARQIEQEFENGNVQDEVEAIHAEDKTTYPIMVVETSEAIEQPAKAKEKRTREIEESIIHSMYGTLNMFIESINDYLTRFPRLITEPKYRDQTKELMAAAKNYINDVEGELK